mmetsp:Transcript_2041/g.6298  ORF Transcript_2041/g.6298 Transcript_2041/m.6298 type:complete len:288 (-) Transcript_2041:513-1376(-)
MRTAPPSKRGPSREPSLGLGVCLDPAVVALASDLGSDKGRAWRVLRHKKLQQACCNNPGKYAEWRARVDKFYKRAVWGPAPSSAHNPGEDSEAPPTASHFKPLVRQGEAALPSQTLWHYYYHGGKTRAERRKENLLRIEQLHAERARLLEERVKAHKDRLAAFARRGLERREFSSQRKEEIRKKQALRQQKLQPEDCREANESRRDLGRELSGVVEPGVEIAARCEAATTIQAQVRGAIARRASGSRLTIEKVPQPLEKVGEAEDRASAVDSPCTDPSQEFIAANES